MVYIKYEAVGSEVYLTQLPVQVSNSVNFVPEFGENTGLLLISTLKANGTSGSPWTSTTSFSFKAVLIKSSQLLAHPELNFNNYNAV